MEPCIAYAECHDQALVGDKTISFWLMDKGTFQLYDQVYKVRNVRLDEPKKTTHANNCTRNGITQDHQIYNNGPCKFLILLTSSRS